MFFPVIKSSKSQKELIASLINPFEEDSYITVHWICKIKKKWIRYSIKQMH